VDSAGWGRRTPQASPHLRIVQDAVFGDRRLRLRYRRAEARVVERDVDPLGLIIKAGVWYLLADVGGERRLFRLSRIEEAEALDQPARRPKRFDLAKAWRQQSADWDSGRSGYEVVAKAATDDDLALLLRVSGDRVVGRPRRRVVRLAFPALEPAAAFVSSFGARVEVIEPDEVRTALARRGAELVKLYESEGTKKAGRPSDRP
jgi:predicted DNA-binding transcriptional regulator YafY